MKLPSLSIDWKLDFDNSYLASKISLQVSLILWFKSKYYLVFCFRMFPAEFSSSVNSSLLVPVAVGCFRAISTI